jgi:hypothetical protein
MTPTVSKSEEESMSVIEMNEEAQVKKIGARKKREQTRRARYEAWLKSPEGFAHRLRFLSNVWKNSDLEVRIQFFANIVIESWKYNDAQINGLIIEEGE